MYQVTCNSVNATIREYVNVLFNQFGIKHSNKLVYEDFCKWIKKHPLMLSSFEKNFYANIWASKDINTEEILCFKDLKAEMKCMVRFHQKGHSTKSVFMEIHGKFMVLLQKPEDFVPFSELIGLT